VNQQATVGVLYVVATPIGNLEDITLRALRILKEVDLIAAEDTRHSGQLLKHFQIETPLISYHAHNLAHRTPELVAKLQAGQTLALITDAGMPGISDPGETLVQACVTSGIQISPIPGATAAITALVASGLATDHFVFEGFLPSAKKERRQRLERLQQESRTMILYAAPHDLEHTLADLITVLGANRPITVAREITKRYEEFWRGSLHAALEHYRRHPAKGELTLVMAGCQQPAAVNLDDNELLQLLQELMQQGLSRSQASRHVAEMTGKGRQQIYRLALQLP
jgi:16S rRNA (cytidine1402-2'-O)-methyltransferase